MALGKEQVILLVPVRLMEDNLEEYDRLHHSRTKESSQLMQTKEALRIWSC